MKIVQVVSGLQKASGVTTFLENLVIELRSRGHMIDVVTKDAGPLSRYKTLKSYNLIHIHGLWDPWLHHWVKDAKRLGVKIIWSPHGMLTKWAFHFKWWKKYPAWYLYQKGDLMKADLIHVTAESEVEDVRRAGLKNKIIIAPLGVRLPPEEFVKSSILLRGEEYCSLSAVSNGKTDSTI